MAVELERFYQLLKERDRESNKLEEKEQELRKELDMNRSD